MEQSSSHISICSTCQQTTCSPGTEVSIILYPVIQA